MDYAEKRRRLRQNFFLPHIKKGGTILEIGPAYNPTFTKAEAAEKNLTLLSLDRSTKEDLLVQYAHIKAKYLAKVDEVDYIWEGGPYKEIVDSTSFDAVISCHMIEHVPDFIGFLMNCFSILSDAGVLCIAAPDKRRHGDIFRPCASISSILDAYELKRIKPTLGQVIENRILKGRIGTKGSWQIETPGKIVPTPRQYPDLLETARKTVQKGYVDTHVWAFTPNYFRWLIEELHSLGLQPFREVDFCEGLGCDFLIILSKHGKGPQIAREELIYAFMDEHGDPRDPALKNQEINSK